MRGSLLFATATALGLAVLAPAAEAQDATTYTFNGTTIWIGGGVQFLTLPDINFTGNGTPGNFRRQQNSDFAEYGGAAGGGIETALGYWGGYRVSGSIKGFWSNLEDDTRRGCHANTCTVIDPTGTFIANGSGLVTNTDRDVDYWGVVAEAKFFSPEPVQLRPNLYRNDYFIIGADIRGIDQDNKLRGRAGGTSIFTYKEDLETTYYGGYIGFGGEYSLGFLGVAGLYDGLGLRSFINAKAGLYSADTDYSGNFAFQFTPFASRLSRSNDELAFIGSVSFETRKQFSARSSLSLWTDYEYISSVPKLRYATVTGRPTRIDDEGAFGSRTMLRWNIGLGPSQLYPPQ